ncbi:TatD family hydrolase [Candidatus Daviesbacteria bacterium]|nr:TatD family hydrolase [Candidatus Daviesbacteria bacterium]
MIDTHTHLQFRAFENSVDQVIKEALKAGVEKMIVVGTNVKTSKKAVELAQKIDCLYAAVGIHPHHIFEHHDTPEVLDEHLKKVEELITQNKVVAIGEVGMDRHVYQKTKHKNYQITEKFINLQKKAFAAQIKLALKHQKSLIIHNREAVEETLEVLEENWDKSLEGKTVFHCCEPDQKLLAFAKAHQIFIGIDGDITYDKAKQEFVKKIPLNLLVLETDSPYLLPTGLKFPNTPANLNIIAEFLAKLLKIDPNDLKQQTFQNSQALFFRRFLTERDSYKDY